MFNDFSLASSLRSTAVGPYCSLKILKKIEINQRRDYGGQAVKHMGAVRILEGKMT